MIILAMALAILPHHANHAYYVMPPANELTLTCPVGWTPTIYPNTTEITTVGCEPVGSN